MATVKIKFRPSIVSSKEGTLSIQIIHNRIVWGTERNVY